MTKKQVIKLVESRLSEVGHGIEFAVVEDGVRKEESWWYLPVLASRRGKDVPRELTVNVYANIEDEFENQHDLNVLFVPVLADENVVRSSQAAKSRKPR